MTFKSTAFVSPVMFNNRDRERYGLNYFESKGVRTHCFVWKNEDSEIPIIDDCLYITTIDFSIQSYPLYKFLSKHKYGIWKTNIIPMSVSWKIRVITFIKSLLCPIRPADYAIIGTKLCGDIICPIGRETKIIRTHTMDYDIFLKNDSISLPYKYVVFLDEFMPFHPDYEIMKYENTVNPESYYGSLNKFFSYIEEKFGHKVVIAEYPISDGKDYFNGRLAIKGKTCGLVKCAEFVISHGSTSLNFAVLYDKPVILITTDELVNSYIGNAMRKMTKGLGVHINNIDEKLNVFIESVDKSYKEKYIKDNNDERFSYEIILDKINASKN